jgi:hypothetical protein
MQLQNRQGKKLLSEQKNIEICNSIHRPSQAYPITVKR